jgi:hypothetical protein
MHTIMYLASVNASTVEGGRSSRREKEDRREALSWLGRRLAWEDVLRRLHEPAEPARKRLARSA